MSLTAGGAMAKADDITLSDLAAALDTIPAAAAGAADADADAAVVISSEADTGAGASRHGLSLRGVDPLLATAIPPPEAFEASPHHPLLITQNPFAAKQQISMDGDTSVTRNLEGINGRIIEVESKLGWGKLEIHIRGTKNTQPAKFEGKKRCVHVAIQARFKRPVVAGDLCIGQELFNEAAVPLWLSEALLTLAAKTFSATTRVSVRTKPRYFMNPVLAACQLINVAPEGQEPGLWDAQEDVRLMLPGAVDAKGRPLGTEARRKWCDAPANIAGATFAPGHVYTFHFWQHYADFGQYRLGIGFLNLDLAPVLHRSPLQLTCRDVGTGLYAFSVLAWHERALYGRGKAGGGEEDAVAEAARQLEGQKLGGRLGSGRLMAGLKGLKSLLTSRSTP